MQIKNKRVKKVKVGVVGVGTMGINHLRVFSQLPNVDLIAIADLNRKTLNSVSTLYNVNVYVDYKKMLEQEDIDAVTVAVPTKLHFDVARDIIARKINLLVEKPLASSVRECELLIEQAKKYHIILGVGHVERFNPVITELRKHLINQKLGRIFQITIRRLGPFPQRVTDVGVFLDLATHDLDIMNYLTGARINRISAESARLVHSKHEDLAVSIVRFTSGVIGVLVENWLSPTKIRDICINGEKGMFIADFISQDLYFYENNYKPSSWESLAVFRGMTEGNMTRFYIDRQEPLRLELESFIEAVLHKRPFFVTPEEGLHSVELAERLLKIANT